MVPSTLGMCRYISHREIVCRGPKNFENPGLEAHDEKAKYMVMSREQNSEEQHNIKTGNISFECMEELKHLGKPVHITIPFVKILIAELTQEMLAIIQCIIYGLPVCYPNPFKNKH
jgi:hypothetical protein